MSFRARVRRVAAAAAVSMVAAGVVGAFGAPGQDPLPPGEREPGAAEKPDPTSRKVVGWRGNWTGLYPEAKPPIEFHRLDPGSRGEPDSAYF